jgi:hypothetical protein
MEGKPESFGFRFLLIGSILTSEVTCCLGQYSTLNTARQLNTIPGWTPNQAIAIYDQVKADLESDLKSAFLLVNSGLEKTNGDYHAKRDTTIKALEALYRKDSARVEKFYGNALKAIELSDTLYNYLQNIKEMMARQAGGWTSPEKITVENDQDLEIPERYFVKQNNGKNGEELREKLEDYERMMKGLVINKIGAPVPRAVQFDIDNRKEYKDREGEIKLWHEYYFAGVPVIAAITELTKFQNDVRNAESEVVRYLYKKAGE